MPHCHFKTPKTHQFAYQRLFVTSRKSSLPMFMKNKMYSSHKAEMIPVPVIRVFMCFDVCVS